MEDNPVQLTLLNAKLHQARVTHAELEYEGSCAVDSQLLKAANIMEFEQLHIYNLKNGERFSTYAICAEEGSGIISVNGAAAHKASAGDRLIICTYGVFHASEVASHLPRLVYLDVDNRIKRTSHNIPIQVA